MKISKLMTACALVALAAACTNDDSQNIPSNYPEDNVIRVNAGVSDAITRATANTTPLDVNSDFSLTVRNKDNSKYSYNNKKFTSVSGEWVCSDLLLWEGKDKEVEIAAYSPYIDGTKVIKDDNSDLTTTVEYSVHTDQTTANKEDDLLAFHQSQFKPFNPDFPDYGLNADGKLDINFQHANSKIDIVVTLGTEFNKPNILTENPITEVIVSGTKTDGTFQFEKAPIYVQPLSSATAKDITATKGDYTIAADEETNAVAKFSCITLPQKNIAAGTFKVTLKTATKTYVWTSASNINLNSGYRYTLNLEMGDNVVLLKGDITAKAWADEQGGTLETD